MPHHKRQQRHHPTEQGTFTEQVGERWGYDDQADDGHGSHAGQKTALLSEEREKKQSRRDKARHQIVDQHRTGKHVVVDKRPANDRGKDERGHGGFCHPWAGRIGVAKHVRCRGDGDQPRAVCGAARKGPQGCCKKDRHGRSATRVHRWEVRQQQRAPKQDTGGQDGPGFGPKKVRHRDVEEIHVVDLFNPVPWEEDQHDDDNDAHHRPRDRFHQFPSKSFVLGEPALEEDQWNEHAEGAQLFATILNDRCDVHLVHQWKQACRDG